MRAFQYTGYSADGTIRRGFIDAESRKQALRFLAEKGIFAEKLGPVQSKGSLSAGRRAMLYRELSTLLTAGLPLERALSLLMESDDASAGWSTKLASTRDAVRDGASIASALRSADAGIEDYESAALDAAEHSATLPEMLMRMAEFLESRDNMRGRLRSAAVYPCFVLALGVLVAFLMLGFLVPKAQATLKSAGISLPPSSTAIVNTARAVAFFTSLIFAGLGIAAASLPRLRKNSEEWRLRTDRWKIETPLFGKMTQALAAARFSSTLAVLIRSGVPVIDGLALAGSSTGNVWLSKMVEEQTLKVRNGGNLSDAVAAIPPLSKRVAEWIRVGESGGCLDAMLDVAATRASSEWERAVTRWMSLFEPVTLVVVGAFVLAVALSVIIPITSITQGIR